ncbi:hypothetical protein HPC62_06335 [Thermoleptolyngbya sichuanensis A183]|uniref:Uncharacterized protein n=1 Tax=Thermoleptolyngbya sichuanensis A183 TaxID=2737172 RepID=A0A6M8B5W0_9CYAN|nr:MULTISPECIES: hypothetical protein [Thermoleptolyngbya]QKD81868.1 hypothetical protein HPC62_06335 [Thermoleptolyngbya sichuanensis A183]
MVKQGAILPIGIGETLAIGDRPDKELLQVLSQRRIAPRNVEFVIVKRTARVEVGAARADLGLIHQN